MNFTLEEKKAKRPHNIVLQNRRQMSLSGVIRVESFNDTAITLVTDTGQLTVEGERLHISKLLLESGDMNIDGEISGLFYTDASIETGGKHSNFISKLFK